MTSSVLASPLIGAARRSEFVNLIFEERRIHRANPHAVLLGYLRRGGRIDTHRKIPLHVHGDAGRGGGVSVYDAGIGEFLVNRARGRGLMEFAKARAGVGIAPT